MTLNKIFDVSLERSKQWHPGGIEEWSALEWAGAMAGEAGEAANKAKKLKRIETSMRGGDLRAAETVKMELAEEAADTILYAVLLMARVGVTNPELVIREVFNRKSEEMGFPQRLEL